MESYHQQIDENGSNITLCDTSHGIIRVQPSFHTSNWCVKNKNMAVRVHGSFRVTRLKKEEYNEN